MFPMFDPSSRVIGYSGRIFGVDDSEGPKYMNSPDGVLFNKSDILYGYHKAKEGIRQWQYAILVEGQMDLLMCHQSGFTNAVATSGTALTVLHLEKLKKISDNLMLVYDADKAGLKATLRAWTQALGLGMDVKVAGLPRGEDPASVLLKGKDEFKNALKNSKHIIDYYLDILATEAKDESHTPEKFRKAVEAEVLPYVAAIDSAIERSNFISRISIKTGMRDSDIREEAEKLRTRQDGERTAPADTKKSQFGQSPEKRNSDPGTSFQDIVTRRIAALLIWLRAKGDKERADKAYADISNILTKEDMERLEADLTGQSEELQFEAEVLFEGSSMLDRDIEHLMYGLEERMLKDRLAGIMSDLQIAEKKGDKERAEELLKACQEISLKLSALNGKRKD
jgi:DNA primase